MLIKINCKRQVLQELHSLKPFIVQARSQKLKIYGCCSRHLATEVSWENHGFGIVQSRTQFLIHSCPATLRCAWITSHFIHVFMKLHICLWSYSGGWATIIAGVKICWWGGNCKQKWILLEWTKKDRQMKIFYVSLNSTECRLFLIIVIYLNHLLTIVCFSFWFNQYVFLK